MMTDESSASAPKEKPRKDDSDNPPVGSPTDFSHPIFKRLSQINGAINKLNKDELREQLQGLGLNSNGLKDVLKKRLKNYWKDKKLSQSRLPTKDHKYDYILVIDFEATCDSTNPESYRHEIIEFPVVVVDCESKKVIDQFHSYVRPNLHPTLTPFCTELTGIQQSQVDAAPPFTEVLDSMWSWVKEKNYDKRMAICTDGPWDMSRFMFLQCQMDGIRLPKWSRTWINLRKSFSNFYDCKRLSLKNMLDHAGFAFQGSPHSGIDDSINIARLVVRLLEDGCKFIVNERIFTDKNKANLQAFKSSGQTVKGEFENLTRAAAEALGSDIESEIEEPEIEEQTVEQETVES